MRDRRWDVLLRIVSGPLASREPKAYRGPVVVLGTAPGPGGVVLPAVRGVEAEHCTVTVYDPTSVSVTALGDNPVRVAPYAEVRWDSIEPIRGQVRLERGSAIHLGPTGQRGVTVEFVACRDLGMQSVVRLASEGADDQEVLPRPPDAIEARREPRVTRLLAESMPSTTFTRVLAGLVGGTIVLWIAALVVWLVAVRGGDDGVGEPMDWAEGLVFDPAAPPAMSAGFSDVLWDVVGQDNRRLALRHGVNMLDPHRPETWDRRFLGAVQQFTEARARSGEVFGRLDQVAADYARVVRALRAEGLPEVLAAIPMHESCYDLKAVSECCAAGPWQWMPEAGPRFATHEGLGPRFEVGQCRVAESDPSTWSPPADQFAPPPRSCAKYGRRGAEGRTICRYTAGCARDFRTDLDLSTQASMLALRAALEDPTLAASGAAVQLAIASHHAGYDDTRLRDDVDRRSKRYNLLHAYVRWREETPSSTPSAWFYGDSMRCALAGTPSDDAGADCQRHLLASTQAYAPSVVADHLLAICYYGRHRTDLPAFQRWKHLVGDRSYCADLDIPTPRIAQRFDYRVDSVPGLHHGRCH